MAALVFNTHSFVKRLTAAGMPEPQAEILADEQAQLIDSRLVTKADIREAEQRIDNKLEKISGEMVLIKWTLGIIIAGIIAIVMKTYFPH